MTLQDEIMTVDELRTYLKIPKPTIYALAQSGRLPAAKIGRHWRFRKADIDHWLTTHRWQGAGQVSPSTHSTADDHQP
jgi:excisionase family DNA binding protein